LHKGFLMILINKYIQVQNFKVICEFFIVRLFKKEVYAFLDLSSLFKNDFSVSSIEVKRIK